MNDQELRQIVVEAVDQVRQGGDGDGDHDGDQPGDELDLTSLELVRLLVNLEELLDIDLDDAAIMNGRLDTVDDIVALMRQSLTVSAMDLSE
ncbi:MULTISPECIES: phosphopantetheine-binding protein [Actinomadura]|uniref:Uncharacterized protein n=2 Tax=Actinomadura TaxID=1988 RepID=A0A5D0TX84_9ACTN|nr:MULTISPECIES: phosphopantetheine-binding protein [Actinomadura]TYC10334.1 hypothetical protein FXF65_30915 [Actinomadura syzygii]TYK52419.1 hypothetical protein FXF68_01120 [Actinomadura decatromicini]